MFGDMTNNRPARLIETVKQRFLSAGGTILEGIGLSKVDVFDDEAVCRSSLSP